MQIHTLKIPSMVSEQIAHAVANALSTIQGVAGIRISLQRTQAEVKFDEQSVNVGSLQEVLAKAGYESTEVPNREEGACCGGCCS
ncbi:MAG: heavy-metal-associated domain-containing protein [Burkholderiales bacterium]|nr:heavy-metal-associated domain-containing protein [Burkholderiales bacterium]